MLATLADRCLPNHREQPRLKPALAAVARFALQDLQVDNLKHFLCFGVVVPATVQRPAKTGLMKSLEFRLEFRDFHPF